MMKVRVMKIFLRLLLPSDLSLRPRKPARLNRRRKTKKKSYLLIPSQRPVLLILTRVKEWMMLAIEVK